MMWLDGEDNSEETEDGKSGQTAPRSLVLKTISQVHGQK